MLIGGRYETIRELGRGGFGKTFLAEDTYRRGRPKCVLKKLQPSSKLPIILTKARELFEIEAQILADLGEHDQIPSVYSSFEENGEFYIAQELIDGHDLRQAFVLGDRWDEKTLITFLREALEVLDVVHRYGVVHQDLKPENLVRRWSDKKLVLIDFGGIKALRYLGMNGNGILHVTKPVGSPGYLAPEQITGQPEPCSDIYAIGMIAIQALTGYLPNQLPRHPITKAVEWHDQAIASPELVAMVDKMVCHDLDARYQTASELLAELPDATSERAAAIASFNLLMQEAKPPQYELLIEPQFEVAKHFSEGMAAVVSGQKLGYINRRGLFSIPPELEFDPISIFREEAYQFSDGMARLSINDRWGFVDIEGRLVIKPLFDSAETFAEGLARVELKHRYGYIDRAGTFVIPPKFESAAATFAEGLAGVEINHHYGYVNKRGQVVIMPQFDTADPFHEGFARITLDGKYGFIDKTGTVVIAAQFDVAHSFSEGLARVRIDERYGYIDYEGTIQIPPQFEDTFSFSEGLALVRNNDKYGFIDKTGKVAIALQFDDGYPFSEGLAAVRLYGKWGFINTRGEFMVDPTFDDAGSFYSGLAPVKVGESWGYLGERLE